MSMRARVKAQLPATGGSAQPLAPGGLTRLLLAALLLPILIATGAAAETTLRLQDLLDEALRNSP
ncbi:MAG: hypothetical protein HGB26_09295, partial [Desulfobulbaceae bacterium]|nr:hypothetical protein [Desulfobulbaceae bacterium]